MERAIIYYAKTGLEATDHFVPELLEKYCKDNGYEIVAMLSEPASTEGVSFPMKYAFIGLNMEEDVNTIITLSKDMIGVTDETVIDTLGKLSEYDIYVEDINGEFEECYEMMYKEPVQESDVRSRMLSLLCIRVSLSRRLGRFRWQIFYTLAKVRTESLHYLVLKL